MLHYNKQDIEYLLQGAAFLGAGGGSYEYGMKLLAQLESMGYAPEFELYDLSEMKEGAYACAFSAFENIEKLDPAKLASDLPAAYEALCGAAKADGHELGYLCSAEMGGFNTMLPVFLSIIATNHGKKTAVLDVDANGRAVPGPGASLASARGVKPLPFGESAHFSAWLMSAEEMKKNAGTNYISYARRIGIALKNADMPLYDALHSVMPQLKELYTGTVEDIITDGEVGLDRGKIIIANSARPDFKLCVLFQNTTLLAGRFENGALTDEIYMTAPDLIGMADADTRKPLTVGSDADISVGQNVTVFLSPAHYYWWDGKKAYESFKPVFEANGHKGGFVQYVPLFEKNRPQVNSVHGMNLQAAFSGNENGGVDYGKLLEHLSENLYRDTNGVSIDKITPTVYTDSEEPLAKEPTITEQDMLRNGPQILMLAKDRYMDADRSEYWAGSFIPHFADEKTTRATREAASRPVFDAFEPATLLSLAIGERVGIITWPERIAPTIERRIAGAGLDGRITMIRALDTEDVPSVDELLPIVEEMMSCGIECIILGRSFFTAGTEEEYRLAERLQAACLNRIPIIDANKAAARWLELNTHMGYFHSRLSYYTPPAKNV